MSNPYLGWLETHFATPDPWDYQRGAMRRFQTALDLLPTRLGRVLEIGCAEGHFTALLAGRSGRVTALELVGTARERAAEALRPWPNVDVRAGDAIRRLPMRRFDLVVCMDVLYYIPTRAIGDVRRRIARRVAPGGLLLVQHHVDDVVVEWDDQAGGAEALHPPFLSAGFESVAVNRDGDIETLLLRRGPGSRWSDVVADARDVLREPFVAAAPDSAYTDVRVDTRGPLSVAGGGSERARVTVAIGQRPIGIARVGVGPDGMISTIDAATELADALAAHLKTPLDTRESVAEAILAGQVPRHTGTPTPRDPEAGEIEVAVCTSRSEDAVAPLLESLAGQVHVTVHENGVPAANLSLLCARLGIEHRFDALPGLSAARNRALRTARSRWVLFLDDDVRIERGDVGGLMARVVGATDHAPRAGVVTGLVLPDALDEAHRVEFERSSTMGRGFLPVEYHHHSFDRGWPITTPDWMGVGACMAVRTDVWDAVGGFDERLGPGTPARAADDDAFFEAVVSAGFTVFYAPSVRVRHAHRPTAEATRDQIRGYGTAHSVRLLLWAWDMRSVRGLGYWLAPLLVHHSGYSRSTSARLQRRGYLAGPIVAARTLWDARRQ